MRNLKKFLALLLSVMMIATTAVIVSAEDATDYTEAAEVLVSTGALKGYTDGKLHLEDDVQRYQMALFIARMMTGDVDDTLWSNFNTTSFTDIDSLSQYVGAISFVTDEGVIKGRSETIFDPYAQITYQEAVTMLVRALGYTDLSYPFGFIQAANKIGLTGGIEGVEWSEPLTRGEVVQLLYNTIKFVSDFGTGDGSYTYEGDCFDKFDSFVIVDDYIADYNATTGYATFSLGEKAALEDLGIEEPSDAILGSWYELFMLEDEVIKIDACEVVDAEADSYMDPAGEEIDEEDLDDDFVAITVYATRENGNVGVVKVPSYVSDEEAPYIGYTYAAGQKSTDTDLTLEWETYRVVSLKDGEAALKLDGDKEATLYTYDYGAALNGIKTAEEIEEILNEALSFGGVVSVVIYNDAIIDAVAGEVEDPIILILDLETLLEVIDEDDECTGFLSADAYSDAFEGRLSIEISAISGDGFSYDYNEVFDPDADDDIALQKAIQKAIVKINNSDKYIFIGTKDKFDKWTLEEAPLYFGKLVFQNEIGKAQIELYPDDYNEIGGSRGEWTLDTSKTKTASVFYDFDPAKDSDDKKNALTGKTYTLGKDVTYYIIEDGKISTFVGQPSTGDVIVGRFVYTTIVSDNDTVIVVADAEEETTVEAPKQYVVSDGVYGRWSRKFENKDYVYYYNLYGLVDYRTDENIVITWKIENKNRNDLNVLEDMVDLLNDKIVEGALYTIDYDYDTKGNDVTRINLVEMTLADYWEDYDIYPYAEGNVKSRDFDDDALEAALGIDLSRVRKVIYVDELTIGLLYDIGFEYDEKTGYLYVYPTEVGAQIVYDKINNTDTYYDISEVKYNGLVYDEVSVDDGGYVRYGHKLVIAEKPEKGDVVKDDGIEYSNQDVYKIGANPDKEINGKFYVSKGADESATVEFALTGGEVTVEYKAETPEQPLVPSYDQGTFKTYGASGYQSYSAEFKAWRADMYNNNRIVDKTLYKYVAWTSDITDVDVFYQRIVPKLTGNSDGDNNYINYSIETVEVENWDIVSPFDLIITGYNNLEDATGNKRIFTADEKSYIAYRFTYGNPNPTKIEGEVYAYGKIVDETGETIADPDDAAVYAKFVQCTEAEYAAQFDGDTRKTGDADKGYRAYEITFGTGLISFNVSNSAGKDMEFNINLIKAYDKTSDGKFVLIDYDGSIVVGARVATTSIELDGTEYKPKTPEVEFSAGKAAKYECVVEKQ